MNNKEFLDKQIRFYHPASSRYYVYYSALPDDHILCQAEPPTKTDSAKTKVGVERMYRSEENGGRIVLEMLMQCDLKVNVTPKLIALFLPNGMQDWVNRLNKFLVNNYDAIV